MVRVTAVQEPPGQIQVRHEPSALLQAVFAAKAEIEPLPKDSTTPHFGSKFTSLALTNEKVEPVLRRHGLLWRCFPTIADGKPALRYRMTHVPSDEQEEDTMLLAVATENPQGQGSGLTYARRYSIWAYLNLVGDEDDDGAAASSGQRASGADPSRDTVDMRDGARGLSNDAVNAARVAIGLPKLEKPWSSLMNIPAEKAGDFQKALDAARAAQ